MLIHKPTLRDVIASLKRLSDVKIPEGDNDGDSFNAVAHTLSNSDYEAYSAALDMAYAYTRNVCDEPDRRSITALNRNGIPTSLNTDQYDPMRLAGHILVNDRCLDIGDREH